MEAPPAGSGGGRAGWLCRHGCPGPGWVGRARLLPEIPSYWTRPQRPLRCRSFSDQPFPPISGPFTPPLSPTALCECVGLQPASSWDPFLEPHKAQGCRGKGSVGVCSAHEGMGSAHLALQRAGRILRRLETLPGQPSGAPTAVFQLQFTELREIQIHVGGTGALRCNINFLVQMWTKRMSPKNK